MISPLLFTASFMFIVCLLLLGVIYSRIHWLLKASLVLISLAFCSFFYIAFDHSLGYPTAVKPDDRLPYVASVVREPAPASHDPGAIYVWLMVQGVPRAIVLPFSIENRHVLSRANQQIETGTAINVSIQKPKSRTDQVPYDVTDDATLEISQPDDDLPRK